MKANLLIILGVIAAVVVHAQQKPTLEDALRARPVALDRTQLRVNIPKAWLPETSERLAQAKTPGILQKVVRPQELLPGDPQSSLYIIRDKATQLPVFIKGSIPQPGGSRSREPEALMRQYFHFLESTLQLEEPDKAFQVTQKKTDDLGQEHWRLSQHYKGLEVYGAEMILHFRDNQPYLLNGRYFPTPELTTLTPAISSEEALAQAWSDLTQQTPRVKLPSNQLMHVGGSQESSQLIIYHLDNDPDRERLVWYLEVAPNLIDRMAYFVDAQTGEILDQFTLTCTFYHDHTRENRAHSGYSISTPDVRSGSESTLFDGPAVATATDLFGISRTINTYELGGVYVLIDAAREMFDPVRSEFPNGVVGGIVTVDAQNTATGNNFQAVFVTSPNNQWSNPTAISAHYNAGICYEYFRQTHQRNAIDGQGGTITSFINVAEPNGTGLDNAFWNGHAMFYGNGAQVFDAPTPAALDIAGHEMSHGVIQNTANMEYRNEPGALNESFADIFGAMIDRDDWQMGEDVTNNQFFPTGAIRDLSDPNNGGNSLADNGWQPANTSEQFRGTQDNGGVHINSGIPNRAFFLFANTVGRGNAERVYYRALDNYLTRSSVFTDCRLAVLQSAEDLFGADSQEYQAACNAFDAVGISGPCNTSGGGGEDLTCSLLSIDANTGGQLILLTSQDQQNLLIVGPDASQTPTVLFSDGVQSKPTVSDDGTLITYTNNLNQIKAVAVDYTNGAVNDQVISENNVWRNAVITKDGRRLAALTTDFNDQIVIFDLFTGNGVAYELYNQTFTEGLNAGEVVTADAMDWDLSGQVLIYDALSVLPTASGNIELWDLNILEAWSTEANDFGSGEIQKLFTSIPEGYNVGDPSFSKNSPFVMAFDFFNPEIGDYQLLTYDFECGAVFQVLNNNTLSFPNYSVDDDFILFETLLSDTELGVGGIEMNPDKLTPASEAFLFQSGVGWPNWYATGTRVLVNTQEVGFGTDELQVFPNPVKDDLQLRFSLDAASTAQVEWMDLLGRTIEQWQVPAGSGVTNHTLPLKLIPPGMYLLRVRVGDKVYSQKVMKN